MAQSNFYDDEDDSFWTRFFKPMDEVETTTSPLPPAENFNAQTYAAALIKRPIVPPPSDFAEVPDLRAAANKKFVEAGFYGDPAADISAAPAAGDTAAETPQISRPGSWKLPGTSAHPKTILGDDTALGFGARLVPFVGKVREPAPSDGGLRPPPPPPALPDVPTLTPPSTLPEAPSTPFLEDLNVRAGLQLSSAHSLVRKIGEAVAPLFGHDPAAIKQGLGALGDWIKNLLPPEHHASVDKSTDAAMADARQRSDERSSANRNRAAFETLAGRTAEAERDYQRALAGGDPARAAAARQEFVQAWRAERIARGDSPHEANAGARALDIRLGDDALQRRLTQSDDSGMQRILETDPDAQRDPAAAQRRVDDIRRIRRDDPARAGQVSVESEIAKRKTDGRIDSDEEETRTRAKLRWQAQAQRGIPEDQRRVFTNEERDAIWRRADEISDPAERKRFIAAKTDETGELAGRARMELAQGNSLLKNELPSRPPRAKPPSSENGEIVPAQQKGGDPPRGADTTTDPTQPRRFGDEVMDEVRRRYPVGRISKEALIAANAEIAIRRGEMPDQNQMFVWGSLANAGPENVRSAAAHAIARIVREAPDIAQKIFEPWQIEAALLVVKLESDELAQISPDDPAHADKRRDILRRVHLDTGNILPPGFGEFLAGALAGGLRRFRPRPLTPEQREQKRKQMKENNGVGLNAEEQAKQIVTRDIECMSVSPQRKRRVHVENDGYTVPDFPLGTKHDQIRVYVEAKKWGARHRGPQRRRLRSLGAHFVEIDPDNGKMRALIPPYEKWIGYEEWLPILEDLLAREP